METSIGIKPSNSAEVAHSLDRLLVDEDVLYATGMKKRRTF